MPAGGYEEDYDGSEDEFDTAPPPPPPPPPQHSEDDDDDEWTLFSSSSPSSSPMTMAAPTFPPKLKMSKPPPILPSSLECSMDDESSSDGEEEVRAPRRTGTPSVSSSELASSQATIVEQRRATIKELEFNYRQQFLSICRTLVPLQQKWRQELEDPVHGLGCFNHLKQEAAVNQKEVSGSRLETQIKNSSASMHKTGAGSAVMSDFKRTPGVGF